MELDPEDFIFDVQRRTITEDGKKIEPLFFLFRRQEDGTATGYSLRRIDKNSDAEPSQTDIETLQLFIQLAQKAIDENASPHLPLLFAPEFFEKKDILKDIFFIFGCC